MSRSGSLVAVNRNRGFRVHAKDAGGVIIHVRDLGDTSVSSGGFDAGVARCNTDDALGAGLAHLAACRIAGRANGAGHVSIDSGSNTAYWPQWADTAREGDQSRSE